MRAAHCGRCAARPCWPARPSCRRTAARTPGARAEWCEADNAFLQEGGVFTQDLIDTWINYKREKELLPFAQRPHPFEYELYFGV